MYYSDDKYKNIPVPKDKQEDIHLRTYNGKSFVLCKEKQLAFKRQSIIDSIESVSSNILKNDTRYKYADNHAKYDEILKKDLLELESQLKNL